MDGSTVTPIAPSLRVTAWRSNAATRIPKRSMCGIWPAATFSSPSRVRAAVNQMRSGRPVSGGLHAEKLAVETGRLLEIRHVQHDVVQADRFADRVVLGHARRRDDRLAAGPRAWP